VILPQVLFGVVGGVGLSRRVLGGVRVLQRHGPLFSEVLVVGVSGVFSWVQGVRVGARARRRYHRPGAAVAELERDLTAGPHDARPTSPEKVHWRPGPSTRPPGPTGSNTWRPPASPPPQ